MKKVYKLEQLEGLKSRYTKEVLQSIEEIITVINENYGGEHRDVDADLGGYVILAEKENDIKQIQADILKGTIEEYTDLIKRDDGIDYYSSLFLLSSDYLVMVYSNKELHKLLLGKGL